MMDQKQTSNLQIIHNSELKDKDELFHFLAKESSKMNHVKQCGLTEDEILSRLMIREQEQSTELEPGIFFPHARFSKLEEMSVIFVVPDKKNQLLENEVPSFYFQCICLMLIPENDPMNALKFMARVAGCLKDSVSKKHFFDVLDERNFLQLNRMLEFDTNINLCAGDLMRPWRCALDQEMPLQEATSMMLVSNTSVVPVLDGDKLTGELSCETLFKLGIPDFFMHLKSVGFIRQFDPFKQYFEVEANSKVSNVMTREPFSLSIDATLIEIVFAIVVQKIPLIYITDPEKKLLGVIDQALLLKRIIKL